MASVITPTSALIEKKISVTIDGIAYSFAFNENIPNISKIENRLMLVPFASEIKIFEFGFEGAGSMLDFKYMALRNRDDTNDIRIRLINSVQNSTDILLGVGKSINLFNRKLRARTNSSAFDAYADVVEVRAQSNVANSDLQIIILN